MVIVEAPFVEELSGMAIIKVLDMNEHVTSMMKFKIHQKQGNIENHKQYQ